MRRHLTGTTRWGFVACVAVSNLLAGLVSVFVWMPLADRILPAEHTMAPWIPMLLSTLLALPIASFVSRRSAKPIQDMLEATKSISRGDYTVRVEEGGSGDVAELLRSFNRMTAELGSTEMMRNDFINTFSHEFKTPIVSIRGFARRLRKGGLTETQQNGDKAGGAGPAQISDAGATTGFLISARWCGSAHPGHSRSAPPPVSGSHSGKSKGHCWPDGKAAPTPPQ